MSIFYRPRGGLAFLHFSQTMLFSLLVYILSAEYFRTKRDDLIYKLVACISITAINIITTTVLILESFYNIIFSQKYFPLILNALFAVIVLALARAFIYDYVEQKNKFQRIIHSAMLGAFLIYAVIQVYWIFIFQPGMLFANSILQLFYALYMGFI